MAENPAWCTPQLLVAWEQGVHDFNEGRFWEAHEAWERGWKDLPQAERTYVQGLIQIAAAFHLEDLGRLDPALRLRASSRQKIQATWSTIQDRLPRLEVQGEGRHARAVLLLPGRPAV